MRYRNIITGAEFESNCQISAPDWITVGAEPPIQAEDPVKAEPVKVETVKAEPIKAEPAKDPKPVKKAAAAKPAPKKKGAKR